MDTYEMKRQLRQKITEYFKSEDYLSRITPLMKDEVTKISLQDKYLEWVTISGMDKYVNTCISDIYLLSKSFTYVPLEKAVYKSWYVKEQHDKVTNRIQGEQ